MKRILYLSDNEENALLLLCKGFTSYAIRQQCDIPSAGMAVFTQTIRKKTGIADSRSIETCREYLARYDAAMASLALSPRALQLFRYLSRGDTLTGTAYLLQCTEAELLMEYESALTAAGIFTRDPQTRGIQTRLFMAAYHPASKPETPREWQILREMARGAKPAEIAEAMAIPLAFVEDKALELCRRIGLIARGRDVQRNLIRAFLSRNAEKEPVDMSDPAF